jgi:hypothetical protein
VSTDNTDNWTINDIRVGNVVQPAGKVPKDEPTAYHSPRLKRTIMDGPGNRSSIINCSCGARFDGVYEYRGHDLRMCAWYAQHAGIVGGGDAVAKILHQYDEALDVRDYPDHPRTRGKSAIDPRSVIDMLRMESEDAKSV